MKCFLAAAVAGIAIVGCASRGVIYPNVRAELERKYPQSSFATFSESGAITLKRTVGPVIVETVRFKRKPAPSDDPSRTEYECTLGLRGAQKDKPPVVFVSLWDKSGTLLGRFPVARYLFASAKRAGFQPTRSSAASTNSALGCLAISANIVDHYFTRPFGLTVDFS